MGQDCITPSEAIRRYEAAHLELPLSHYEDGLIGASIGFYRLYEGAKGEQILLFGFNESDFPEQDELRTAEDLSQNVFLVEARISVDAPRWVQDAISSHQSALYKATMETRRLYEVKENTFANMNFGYKIFPIADEAAEQNEGEDQKLRFEVHYYPFSGKHDDIVDVDKAAPEGILGALFTKGVEIGRAETYAEARQLMMDNYQEKLDKIWSTGAPQSLVDKVKDPNLTIREFGAKARGYLRNTPARVMLMDLGIAALTAVGGPLGGIGYTMSQAANAMRNARTMINQHETGDLAADISEDLVAPEQKKNLLERLGNILTSNKAENRVLGRRLNPILFKGMKPLTDEESHIRPEGAPVFSRLGEKWVKKWLLGAFQARKGTIVRPRNDGVVTIESTSGLIVHHIPGKNKAYATMSGDLCPDEAGYDLPTEVEEVLQKSDYVMVSYNEQFGYESRHMTKKQFLENVYAETRNRAWIKGLYDQEKQAMLEDPNYCPLEQYCPDDISEDEAERLSERIEEDLPVSRREQILSGLFDHVSDVFNSNEDELALADRRVITRALEELQKGRDRAIEKETQRREKLKEAVREKVKPRLADKRKTSRPKPQI